MSSDRTKQDAAPKQLRMFDAEPDFAKCGSCGADARKNCVWDPADGWCCSRCGGCDSDE